MHLLGLDVGTTGCKAIVFDARGTVLAHAFHEYDIVCLEPGMAEQDAERVWALTRGVLKEAAGRSGVKDLAALSVSVQGDAILAVDRDFTPLHPAILGMDYRSEPQARWCEEHLGGFELFQQTGMRPHPINSIIKTLWLRHRHPEVFDRAWKIVTYADFILGKLGAEPVIDHTMASRTMAFDLKTRQWSAELLSKLGLSSELLSRPVPSGTAVGTVPRKLAEELGLSSNLLLVAGGHDQPCAALGAGIVREGLGVVSTGSAEVLATTLARPALTREMFNSFYPCYLHAKEGMYFTFSLNHVGGILFKWYRDNFAHAEVTDARQEHCDPYALIDARLPGGPSPLMVVPHWNGSGTPHCDLQAKGAVVGWTMASTRHDLAKAVLEGLTFELLINLNTMLGCGVEVNQLGAAGGGAKSALWLQMKADVLNRPIRTLRCREAACLGAALLAGTGAGIYQSIDQAVAQTVGYEREFVPQPEMVALYRGRFATYQQLCAALREVNRA